MSEVILAITQTIIVIAIILYFYKREGRQSELIKNLANEQSLQTSKLIEKTFSEYLKHIQKLEMINVPKPVTQKAVQAVLNMTPPMAEANDIEKQEDQGIEINESNLSKIPISRDTKVIIEGDDFPTEVI